jgi:hypothetical protein
MSMTEKIEDSVIASMLPDISDVPLTADVAVDDGEYAQILRDIVTDNSGFPVSFFNSSI